MEEEIDLRVYISALFRRWYWIVGLSIIAAVVAFVALSLLPATYEASAVVVVTRPRYQMQFDPRFELSQEWTPAYRAFPTLAVSDGVLEAVVDAYVPSARAGIEEWNLLSLSRMVEASSGNDPSLVILAVRSRSRTDAAGIVNVWADVLTKQGNAIYGESEQSVSTFEEQVGLAEQALNVAEAALIEFQSRNEASIVGAELESLQRSQSDYLADQRAITYISQDIAGLRNQLAEQSTSQPASLADSLTALFLQIKAFNAQASVPIQLQVSNVESLSSKSLAEQVAFLDDLLVTLQTKSAAIDTHVADLGPQILALQQELEEINTESSRLTRTRDLASETYITLVRKLDEARIASQEESGILQVGSYGAIPQKRAGPGMLVTTALAAILGLMAGVAVVLALEFWQSEAAQAQSK